MIAPDYSASNTAANASSITWSHTCSGTNRILVVGVSVTFLQNGGVDVLNASYNGVSMSSFASVSTSASPAQKTHLFYLIAPATGSNSVVVNLTGGNGYIAGCSQSYTGANQSTQPETTATSNSISFVSPGVNEISASVTVSRLNDFGVCFTACTDNSSDTLTATPQSAILVIRQTSSTVANGSQRFAAALADTPGTSNVGLPTGSNTLALSWNNSSGGTLIIAAVIRAAITVTATPSDSVMNGKGRLASLAAGSIPTSPPAISVRQNTSPFALVATLLNYIKTSIVGTVLPVLSGEQSNPIYFRIYNNFTGGKGVADAINVNVTTYDGSGMTASMAVASQQWLHVLESGFGQGSSGGGLYTALLGTDTAVGGSGNRYAIEYSSSGAAGIPTIQSASYFPGAGFAELKSYILPMVGSTGQLNSFVISIAYEYVL